MQNEWPFNSTSSTSCKCTTQAIHSSHPCCNICISHVCHDLKRATWPHRVSWFSWRAGCHTTAMKWSILHNQVPKHKKRLANQKPRSATFTTAGLMVETEVVRFTVPGGKKMDAVETAVLFFPLDKLWSFRGGYCGYLWRQIGPAFSMKANFESL